MKKFFLLIGLFCFQYTKSVRNAVLVIKDQKLSRAYELLEKTKKRHIEAIKDTYPQAYAFYTLIREQLGKADAWDLTCMPPKMIYNKNDEWGSDKNKIKEQLYNAWLKNQKFGLIEIVFHERMFFGMSLKETNELFFEQMREYVETCDTDIYPWDKLRELYELDSSAIEFENYYKEKDMQKKEKFMGELQAIYENEED